MSTAISSPAAKPSTSGFIRVERGLYYSMINAQYAVMQITGKAAADGATGWMALHGVDFESYYPLRDEPFASAAAAATWLRDYMTSQPKGGAHPASGDAMEYLFEISQ